MIWVWLSVLAASIGLSYTWWPRDKRSWKVVAFTALTFSATIMLGIYITQAWPVEHYRIEKIQKKYVNPPKVIYKDRIVYRIPGKEFEPLNAADICKGSRPVKLLTIDISKNGDDSTTWLIVKPLGSEIKITCYISGNLDHFWQVGDIVQFTNGKPE